jgi:hypothetical protein
MDLALDATLTSLASEMRIPKPPARMTAFIRNLRVPFGRVCACHLDVFVCQYVYIDKASSRFYGLSQSTAPTNPNRISRASFVRDERQFQIHAIGDLWGMADRAFADGG